MHDDGTLENADVDALRQAILEAAPQSAVVLIPRATADELVRPALASYPACQRFRDENPLALKLFDVMMLPQLRSEATPPTINYCDSDVYFLRRFRGLFDVPADCDGVFQRDVQNLIAWRSWQVLTRSARFTSRLNTGLFCIRPALRDLPRLEWYLRQSSPPILRHFVEQTAWAMLAAQGRGVRMLDPRQFPLAHPSLVITDDTVGVHYVRTYRDLLKRDVTRADAPLGPAVEARTISAGTIGAGSIALEELRRVVGRRL